MRAAIPGPDGIKSPNEPEVTRNPGLGQHPIENVPEIVSPEAPQAVRAAVPAADVDPTPGPVRSLLTEYLREAVAIRLDLSVFLEMDSAPTPADQESGDGPTVFYPDPHSTSTYDNAQKINGEPVGGADSVQDSDRNAVHATVDDGSEMPANVTIESEIRYHPHGADCADGNLEIRWHCLAARLLTHRQNIDNTPPARHVGVQVDRPSGGLALAIENSVAAATYVLNGASDFHRLGLDPQSWSARLIAVRPVCARGTDRHIGLFNARAPPNHTRFFPVLFPSLLRR